VYFHNWAGYDIFLSLAPLLSLANHGFKFEPTVHNGKVICLKVFLIGKRKNTLLLTIKDSFKLLPSALGKLALEFKVEQQKEHFPHYFNPLELHHKLDYIGIRFFDFDSILLILILNLYVPALMIIRNWKNYSLIKSGVSLFEEVSRSYIKGDVVSLHQILVKPNP
jgi:hypothetical protein